MNSPKLPVIGFAAFSGTGKTTLVTQVIPILRKHGLKLGVLKHAHHNFVIDVPGKDSYELRKAGAQQVLIASKNKIAWVKEKEDANEPELMETLKFFTSQNLDLIVVEGFKKEPFTKIEVQRAKLKRPLLAKKDPNVIAIATDAPETHKSTENVFHLEDYEGIAQFIIERMKNNMLTEVSGD